MHKGMKKTAAAVLLTAAISGCFWGPTQSDRPDVSTAYYDAAWLLDIYFLFRERMPVDLYAYDTPVQLYRSVNEEWTVYFTKEQSLIFLSYLTTSTGGIGIYYDWTETGLRIREVFPDSPGKRAGLLAGDTIVEINQTPVSGMSLDSAGALLRGDLGDHKYLVVLRDTGAVAIEVVLGSYLAPSVFADSLDSSIAYISLTLFTSSSAYAGGSSAELRTALDRTGWAAYTILDLRGNPGGELGQCYDIAEEFVPAGTPVIRSEKRGIDSSYSGRNRTYFGRTELDTHFTVNSGAALDRRIYVLVDEGTASAAEIIVSLVRDSRPDIKTVGVRTYGKGRAQVIFGIGDNNELYLADSGLAKITYARLMPLLGAPYDSIGIVPDVVIDEGADALDVAAGMIHAELGTAVSKRARTVRRLDAIRTLRREIVPAGREPMAVEIRKQE